MWVCVKTKINYQTRRKRLAGKICETWAQHLFADPSSSTIINIQQQPVTLQLKRSDNALKVSRGFHLKKHQNNCIVRVCVQNWGQNRGSDHWLSSIATTPSDCASDHTWELCINPQTTQQSLNCFQIETNAQWLRCRQVYVLRALVRKQYPAEDFSAVFSVAATWLVNFVYRLPL